MTKERRSARLRNLPSLDDRLQLYSHKKLGDDGYSYSPLNFGQTVLKDNDEEKNTPNTSASPIKKTKSKNNFEPNSEKVVVNGKEADYASLFKGISNGQIKSKKSNLTKRPPRSKANKKFKAVYKASPQLRNVSPPRFTTDGVPKAKLDFEKIGVEKLGKVIGNPYSKYQQRRNNILYGNVPLTEEDETKIKELNKEMKKTIADQTGINRKSSSINIPVLHKVKKELGLPRAGNRSQSNQESIVDIESLEDTEENEKVKPKCGRKPGKTVLQCGFCGYKTTHSGHMKVHIISVHEQTKKYKCTYEDCTYECTRKGSMVRHEKCVHRKDLLYQCPRKNCKFESAWTKSLERHIVTVHEQMRPWKCSLCNFGAGQHYTLQLHIETMHKKLKTVRCAFCDFRSTAKNIVKTHIVKCHKDLIGK